MRLGQIEAVPIPEANFRVGAVYKYSEEGLFAATQFVSLKEAMAMRFVATSMDSIRYEDAPEDSVGVVVSEPDWYTPA